VHLDQVREQAILGLDPLADIFREVAGLGVGRALRTKTKAAAVATPVTAIDRIATMVSSRRANGAVTPAIEPETLFKPPP
jgi:hypothetical protein